MPSGDHTAVALVPGHGLSQKTVEEWGAEVDAEGKALCRAAEWWKKLEHEAYRKGMTHRTQSPSHYVFGVTSPMYIEQFLAKAKDHAVFAVYFGQQSNNTRGVVQGGAICSIFDLLCAATASFTQGKVCVTRSVTVEMLKPIPIRSLVRAEARLKCVDGRKVIVDATMSDGSENENENEKVYATASVVHVVMSHRKAKI